MSNKWNIFSIINYFHFWFCTDWKSCTWNYSKSGYKEFLTVWQTTYPSWFDVYMVDFVISLWPSQNIWTLLAWCNFSSFNFLALSLLAFLVQLCARGQGPWPFVPKMLFQKEQQSPERGAFTHCTSYQF